MDEQSIFMMSDSPAAIEAAVELNRMGLNFCASCEEADALLYDVPTPAFIRDDIPRGKLIIGGNLDFLDGTFPRLDLLKDPYYLAQNARITAEAALGLILPGIGQDFSQAPVLILGWGRIGKCLDQLFRRLDFPVSVYARNHKDRAMLSALGYTAVTKDEARLRLPDYSCIINTAPDVIFQEADWARASKDCILLDLASTKGILHPRANHARGLPGRYKPKASGKLIAQTIIRYWKEVTPV